ncbi:MAG: hypothetical protein UV74_C0013G0036 [Candidatus Woesebacteria bacterium GW2011_GWB1_43_14]|uniref:Large ribosomal subunit protein uL1 n=1 Tax=Candidatus Woesebacteria bacterium GW2011_GWB1_43_14 TaxID=1618578 RepID=A0A0G1DGU3_9BACT|nr:MAG: hypothetical protein UV51_C0009G0039 [Candidatus Woesebacteria bacterium GW2011_GWC1_42_9]KKS96914.1 MAG: hypothetical protein UV74_C0013G0036 [Candidatus Woesebacteria bacterium GW2011_GWB1_43_14]
MGKTKTTLISEEVKEHKTSKVRIAGLKGGERVKAMDAGPIIEKVETEEKKPEKRVRPPKVRGAKYKAAKAKIDKSKKYSLSEAIKLVKETSFSSFDGSVEMHLKVKKSGLAVNVQLPKAASKKRVEVANEQTIEKLKKGKIDFDILLAMPEFMPKLIPFAHILGPKGLMPNPKLGTLIKSEEEIKKFSANTINLKTEKKAPLMHTVIGKVSWDEADLVNNAQAIIEAVTKNQIADAYLASSMGPSVKLEVA